MLSNCTLYAPAASFIGCGMSHSSKSIFGAFDDRFRDAADDTSESGTADASWSGSTSSNYSGAPPAHGGAVDEFNSAHAPSDLTLSYDAAPQDTTVAPFVPAAYSGNPDAGYSGAVANDGNLWTNDGSSAPTIPVVEDSNTTNSDGGINFSSGASSNEAPGIATPDSGSAQTGYSDQINGDNSTTTSINSTNDSSAVANITSYEASASSAPIPTADAIPAPDTASSSSQSAAPTFMWSGDLGSFAESGLASPGTGAGSGSTGSVVQEGAASAGLVINVDWDASVANAPAGFVSTVDAVVSFYESHFTNPVAITIDVGWNEIAGSALQSGALGESETGLMSVSYAQLQSALVKNADAIGDTAAAASLPTTSPVSGQYWISTAEAEALGLTSTSGAGGYVGFSSAYSYAYNESSVGAGQYDLFGVVAHEISEVMGRQTFDGSGGFYEPEDLFHYSAPGVRDFSGTTAGYVSANGGATSLYSFNTNPNGDFGDWASSAGNNSYDAFMSSGTVNPVTAADLTVMNLLGWDPSGPVVTVQLVNDTGGTNNVTSNDALTGTADANATVTLSEGSTVLGSTTANASASGPSPRPAWPRAAQTITASETNAAGLTGSSSLTFTYDTVAPTVTEALAHSTGANNVTSNDALTGTADANATVTLTEGSTVLGTTTANANGVWALHPDRAWPRAARPSPPARPMPLASPAHPRSPSPMTPPRRP